MRRARHDDDDDRTQGIVDLSEPSTCNYLIWWKLRAACKAPQMQKQVVQDVACYLMEEGEDAL